VIGLKDSLDGAVTVGVRDLVDTLTDTTAPRPALPGRTADGLSPGDLADQVRSSDLVDAVDEATVAAVAAAVDEATSALVAAPAGHREASAVRSPVDLEVVIPAYNESGRLPATLTAMVACLSDLPWTARIVVVDNGSADDTAASVLAVPSDGVEVVAVGCSRAGKGAAVHRGLRTSRSRFVGFTDADLSTPLETFRPALAALEDGAAAAIASRHAPGASVAGRQPLGRRLGGTAFRLLTRPLLPGVHDTQCGFKFFDRAAVQAALWRCRSTGFAFDVELLRLVRDDGGHIAEIPVTWTDAEGSTLRPVRDGLAAFTAVARLHRELARTRPAPRVSPSVPAVSTAALLSGRPS
jgi:dolichyl-phosphate beta-glucosyltransferase